MSGKHPLLLCAPALVLVLVACRPELPFGAPCDVDADCVDDFVCARSSHSCVPDEKQRGGDEGEGEGEEGEGEGEGEGEPPAGVEYLDVSGAVGVVRAVSMDARGSFMAVVVVEEFGIRDDGRVDLYRIFDDGTPEQTTVVANVGTFGHWVSVAVDSNQSSWIAFNAVNADSTGNTTSIVGVDSDGAVIVGPVEIAGESGSQTPRAEVAVGSGGAGVVVKGGDGAVGYYEQSDGFTGRMNVMNAAFFENGLQRVALAFDLNGDAHILAQRGRQIEHAERQGGGFTLRVADEGDEECTYVALAFDAAGVLHASYDLKLGLGDFFQCSNRFDGGAWGVCDPVPVDFNTHGNTLAVLNDSTDVMAWADASAEAPVIARGDTGAWITQHIDDVDISFITIAVRGDGRPVVAYSFEPAADTGRVRLAIMDR